MSETQIKTIHPCSTIVRYTRMGNGIAEIQDASGFYMLQSTLPHKTLLQANREIGLHLQFITQLASNVGFLKQLEGILYYHSQNVENLLKRVKEESTDTF